MVQIRMGSYGFGELEPLFILQLSETILISVTCMLERLALFAVLEEVSLPMAELFCMVPVTRTVWPTCFLKSWLPANSMSLLPRDEGEGLL